MAKRTGEGIDISKYLAAIRKEYAGGHATEHTHRPALKTLLESADAGIVATNEPRRIACGSPDFQITRQGVPLGHVETKDIGANLDEMERGKGPHGEQFIRYRDGLPNWLLTDYLDFRWFVGGEKRLTVRIADLDAHDKIRPLPDADAKLAQFLAAFFDHRLTIATARDLAERMAGMTRIARDLIIGMFEHEREEGWLHNWLAAFRKTLIPKLDEQQFADMFAQTLAYGLFAARVHAPPGRRFSREMAAYDLPKTNPFLRRLFAEIAGVSMPDSVAWAVDDIVALLDHADMAEILTDFGKGKGKEDLVVHFYETFLAAYDPKMRELRGVYYTPAPVAGYIVRSVDHLLRTAFGRRKGLADEDTLILDPAVGTGTFLYLVVDQIRQKFAKQRKFAKQSGAWDNYVAEHLLNRLFGFELLMAPYAVAHLKLGMKLQETGYRFESDQRLGIYLTNTLEEGAIRSEYLTDRWFAEEANAAAEIKNEKEIVVVTGNPPYSSSICESAWIMSLIKDYKRDLGEKKADLNREEWKFLRFAQWRIDKTGEGIVAFVINNSFLDAITHRKMRASLLRSFQEIYVLDLHGSVKRRDTSRKGEVDENVFDIEQGVAIAILVKHKNSDIGQAVRHAELAGPREAKYEVLAANDVSTTKWRTIKADADQYFFVPRSEKSKTEYYEGFKITDVFPAHCSGIQTKKDRLTIHFQRSEVLPTAREFAGLSAEEARQRFGLGKDSSGWSVKAAQDDLRQAPIEEKRVVPILYRPFDVRFTYYTDRTGGFLGRPRAQIMRHMLRGPNIGMIAMRQIVGGAYSSFGVTNIVNCHGTFYLGNKGQDYLFPLFLYPDAGLLGSDRVPNLGPSFLQSLAGKLRRPQCGPHNLAKGITPEEIFHYAYAVFHSPSYRNRYAEFLKIDFPRLPLTRDVRLFRALAARGAKLVTLHLLESPNVNDFLTDWPVQGDNLVEKVQFTEKGNRVWINKTQYFGRVPRAVWDFQIGGYQVCDKWLKDRKGHKLTYDDTQHYQRMVVALNETIRLMAEVDEVVGRHGGWPIR